jgi:hypothetical protein
MSWVFSLDNDLLNLDHVKRVFYREADATQQVTWEAQGHDEDTELHVVLAVQQNFHEELEFVIYAGTESECRDYLAEFAKKQHTLWPVGEVIQPRKDMLK